MKAWKGLLEMGSENRRLEFIRKIFRNDFEIYELITNQIKILKEYQDKFGDISELEDEKRREYEHMLNLLGLTSETFNDEWDDETDRKS